MPRTIFHIDVNSAYLSWTAVEQLKNGAKADIRTIPAIIGGNQESRHGVVLAKSIPAKKYGIRTGEPVANALRKCPDIHIEPPDHELYRAYSRKLMDFLHTYTPDIEQVSVDECYLDYTGIAHQFYSPVSAALEIKEKIYKKFGFTVNIGISSNKVLAKMASDFEKPGKVHTLFPEEIRVKMWPLPVRELYMAGGSSVETLKKLGIHTIGDPGASSEKPRKNAVEFCQWAGRHACGIREGGGKGDRQFRNPSKRCRHQRGGEAGAPEACGKCRGKASQSRTEGGNVKRGDQVFHI